MKEMKERAKEVFNKSDLVTGDILVTQNGQHYVVMNGYGGNEKFNAWVGLDVKGWRNPENYSKNMNCYSNDNFDIVRVIRPNFFDGLFELNEDYCEIMYEQKDSVKMSVEDMKKKLEELTGDTIEVI